MAQLAIYIDDKTAREIKKVSRQSGVSRSEWVSKVIKKELKSQIPKEFFQVLGTWEDDRSSHKILKDIRENSFQKPRPEFR